MIPTVTLYSKPGCHLCETAVAELKRLQTRHPHTLELIDITASADLMRDYGERIPVVSIDGIEYAAPLGRADLEKALGEAGAS
jgi:hypothetical protein